MSAICLLVAGSVAAALPADEFTLLWTHTVQKTPWTERYRAEGATLRLVEASVESSGAGMDPPTGATLDRGRWTWRPGTVVPELVLRRSAYAADYTLCSGGRCAPLGTWAGTGSVDAAVTLRPCPD
jgi:hypothetical protein